MSGILSSCCPFLSNGAREGRGSPPYTADAMRLRIHNWANSLSGSTQIPRQVTASVEDKTGLPELSSESSAITFVKSEISCGPEESEGVCEVILPPREGYSEMDQVVSAAIAADFHPIPDGDWESEKGLEEEDVTLLQRRQAGDDELNMTCLERKAANTILSLKSRVVRPTFEVSSALPFKSKTISNRSSLPHIPEQPLGPLSFPDSEPTITLPASQEETSQESTEPVVSTEHRISPTESSKPSSELSPSSSYPVLPLLTEQPTKASSSSELLDAISNLPASHGAGKTRRSRMTSTRAPTPWSTAAPDDHEDEAQGRVAEEEEEEEQLERVSSSGSSSLFESVTDTAESSFHTLPTASNSVERADKIERPSGTTAAETHEPLPDQVTPEEESEGEKLTVERPVETAKTDREAIEETKTEVISEATDEILVVIGTEPTAETVTDAAAEASVQPVALTVAQPVAEPVAETIVEPKAESSVEPAAEPSTRPAAEQTTEPVAEPATALVAEPAAESAEPAAEPVTVTTVDTADGTAAGDRPPPNLVTAAAADDDVNLRYFCGAFRPVDHYMTRYAGLESAATAAEAPTRAVPSGRSDSAVLPPGHLDAGRRGGAASDSRLPPAARSSSPDPPAGDDSGVQLEAKRSSTDIPT